MERSADPYDIDDEGNPVPPTWKKASHTVQRDISQQEARRKVRELDKETSSVTDKKNELSSTIQRQLEHAWNKLENMETDPRFVYTLAQLDWKLKRIETAGAYDDRKHDRRSKDKKRSKERYRSKMSPSRSKPKRERVSVTAYFKREPARNENCVRMLKAQQAERREHEGGSLPMMIPGQPPQLRPALFNTAHSLPQIQTHQPAFVPQVQCRFPLNQPPNAMVNQLRGPTTAHPPFPPPHPPPPQQPSSLPARIPPAAPLESLPRNNIPRAIEAQNRRIQSYAPIMERQATAGSHNSRSSVTSFSSLSGEDSDTNLTPNSSIDPSPPHHDGRRGRSRYRQHRDGGESVALEVARNHERPHNPADRFIGIPPPAPDPVKAVSEAYMLRRAEQQAYREEIMDAQVMARSMTSGHLNPTQQPRTIHKTQGNQRAPLHHAARYSLGRQDMDRLGDRLSRTSLADDPRSRTEAARDPAIHYEYREAPRRYQDDFDDEIIEPGSSRGPWRRQDAQRYMADRRRTDQDAWDLGTSGPLRYGDSQQRSRTYAEY
ncbi:hypothetical protein V8C42DRAFT_314126, partial [Trichoderma barbatum]